MPEKADGWCAECGENEVYVRADVVRADESKTKFVSRELLCRPCAEQLDARDGGLDGLLEGKAIRVEVKR